MPKAKDLLHLRPEWSRVTLARISDAVITTDTDGRVTFLNPVAESLTGWTQAEAAGVPLEQVFQIVHPETRKTVESPTVRALREGVNAGLTNRTLLIAKNGTELPIGPINDSAAPIRNDNGELVGAVLVFRDITELYRQERAVQIALAYADKIIAALREPFVVLDANLRVKSANRSFYQNFHVEKDETEGRFIYDLGNGQWNIPRLRTLLDEVQSNHHPVHDFDMEHDFPTIGKKMMLLNAQRFESGDGRSDLSRELTGKTAINIIKMRYYGTAWVLIGLPLLYFLRPKPVGAFGMDGHAIQTEAGWWGQFLFTWGAIWLSFHGVTWVMTVGMHLAGAIFNNSAVYQQWLEQGGHPFWDSLYFWNNDPPQVRAAIGIPPAEPACCNCGASLTGLFGLGSNYGNVCPSCGYCNDTFPEG